MKEHTIAGIPAHWYRESGEDLLFAVHGLGGSKTSLGYLTGFFPGAIVAVDLPGHGERTAEADRLTPMDAVPELRACLTALSGSFRRVFLYAESLGAYFSLLAFPDAALAGCFFVSPVLDMEGLIAGMMREAGVDEARLRREGVIPTAGQPLRWEYLTYVREHPVADWKHPTFVLSAGGDTLTPASVARDFAGRFGFRLSVMPGGEHWFHTPEETAFRDAWFASLGNIFKNT